MISNLNEINFNLIWLNQFNLPPFEDLPTNCKMLTQYKFESSKSINFMQRAWDKIGIIAILRPIIYVLRGIVLCINLSPKIIKIILLIKLRKPDSVWMVAQGDKLIIIYFFISLLFKKSTVLVLHQWDPISWWLNARGYPQWYFKFIQKILDKIEFDVALNIVPSESWQRKLKLENKKALHVDNFFLDSQFDFRYIHYSYSNNLSVVFIGQLYAGKELEKICELLEKYQEYSGAIVTLHYFGGASQDKIGNIPIISHGFFDADDLTREISIYDVALLPYPMSEGLKETAELSFPSKCRQYMLAGLPIFAYAPLYSGVHIFLNTFLDKESYFNGATLENSFLFLDELMGRNFEERKRLHLISRDIARVHFSESAEMNPFQMKLKKLIKNE
jgi:hypothetical protein